MNNQNNKTTTKTQGSLLTCALRNSVFVRLWAELSEVLTVGSLSSFPVLKYPRKAKSHSVECHSLAVSLRFCAPVHSFYTSEYFSLHRKAIRFDKRWYVITCSIGTHSFVTGLLAGWVWWTNPMVELSFTGYAYVDSFYGCLHPHN